MKLFGPLTELLTLAFRKGGKQVTVQPPAAPAADLTFTLPTPAPATTDVLVGEGSTQTLTNKTLSGAAITGSSTIDGYSATSVKNGATLANAATDVNTASTIVRRSASGNFSAGMITANLTGNVTGNADTATTAGGAPPTGSAGGDLSGTFPNPSVATVGGVSAANVASGANAANAATNTNTPSTIVKRDGSGNFSAGTITAALAGTATGLSGSNLTGDVTNSGNTVTVATVGTVSAANVASGANAANAATNLNTPSTIVKRDASGNFAAGTITANLTGTASQATTSVSFSGSLNGDVTGTQSATVVGNVGGSSAANVNAATILANAATNLNTNSTIVKRDASGNFSATTITANLSGNATNVTGIVATANGGTGINSTATFPSTGTVVTRDATETLLNKTTVSSTGLATGALTLPSGSTAQQPGTPINGMVRYNSDNSAFEGYASGVWSPIGGGGTTDTFTQSSPALSVGDVVYLNGSVYTKAIATAANTAEVIGVISKGPATLGTNKYEITLSGEVSGFTGLTVGEMYFLSPSVAGGITVTEPTTLGQVSAPIGVASSATSLYVAPKRGVVVGGTNARTQITLTAVTTAQTVYTAPAGVQAGELVGWVYLDATTDKKFYVSAPFAQNGLGTDWNISPSYVGDTPPTGFGITITSAGLIQITMSTLPAGFVTGYINYAVNAPAVGATFPLNVDASTITAGTVAAARLPVVVPGTSAGVVAAAGLPGNTTGSVIASGYVGETVSANSSGSVALTNPTTSICSINLTAGVWMIFGMASANPTSAGTGVYYVGISTSPSANDSNSFVTSGQFIASGTNVYTPTAVRYVNLSASQTYHLTQNIPVSPTGTWGSASFIRAVRIA